MKKRVPIIILMTIGSMLPIWFACNGTAENDWTRANLRGKVRSFREARYKAVDRFGNIEKGEPVSLEAPTYDILRTLFKRNWYYLEKRFSHLMSSYDRMKTFKYDQKGNMIEVNRYDSDGRLDGKLTFKYDKKGNMIEVNRYDSDGRLAWKSTYKYDEKGNMIEVNRYDSDGSLAWKETYKYDEKGNVIEMNTYDSDGRLDEKWTYKYDEKGNVIEKKKNEYNSYGRLDEKWTFQYEKWTYQYEYDKAGNWTKKIEFGNGKPVYIYERIYEYYE